MTRIVCISDTHNLHHRLELPEGDVLIHAGDATMRGSKHEIESFLQWFSKQPHPIKLFVPGNHDFGFDRKRTTEDTAQFVRDLAVVYQYDHNVTILRDKSYTLPNGMMVYGTPWVQGLESWAFGWKSVDGRAAEFAAIPPETQILISHGPQYGKLDLLYDFRLGDEVLAQRIAQLPNLKLHIHGHIHHSYGTIIPPTGSVGLISVNAAMCNENYSCVNEPIVIEL